MKKLDWERGWEQGGSSEIPQQTLAIDQKRSNVSLDQAVVGREGE